MLTEAQAIEQAVQLYYQNINYSAISRHLAKVGFTSAITRKPLTPQAVRYKITEHLKKTGKPLRDPNIATRSTHKGMITAESTEDTPPITVRGDKADLLHAVRTVTELDINADVRLEVLRALLNSSKGT